MVRNLDPDGVADWVADELLSEARTRPIVGLTTHQGSGRTWFDADALEQSLGEAAEVVVLETGEATWALADALPPQLEAYGGAVRIWWPGLERESDPYQHRLYFIRSPRDAQSVFDDIVQSIRGPAASTTADEEHPVTEATVVGLGRNHVELLADGREGELRWVDGPFGAVVQCLEVGSRLPVRPVRRLEGNRWAFSARGLFPHPWELVGDALARGDIVQAKVAAIVDDGVIVEVLPRVEGFVYWTYVDWDIAHDELDRSVHVDQIVRAKIAEIDAPRHRLKLSIRDAHEALGAPTKPLPSLVPGGLPFWWAEPGSAEPGASDPGPLEQPTVQSTGEVASDNDRRKLADLTDQLEAADGDRKDLRDRIRDLKKQLRSATDKLADLEKRTSHEIDPLASDRAFLLAVRVTYARMFDEGTRQQYPLKKMRVHGAFLDSVRSLEGIELTKILDVCAQVASGMAPEIEGREVHQLRVGSRGSKNVVRPSDGAIAWRCALQVHTASARRLHWWAIPGPDGQTVEFAKVGVHDDTSIPD